MKRFLLVWLLLVSICYCAFAFYFLSFNPNKWGQSERGIFGGIALFAVIIAAFLHDAVLDNIRKD